MERSLIACFCTGTSSGDKIAIMTKMWLILSWSSSGRCEEATKAVVASARESGSSSSARSCSGAPSGLPVHVVSVAVCLAGGPPLLEAPVPSMSISSSAVRRFCPEEAGRGAAWIGQSEERQGRVMGGTSSSMASRSFWNSGKSSSKFVGWMGLAMKSRACDSLTGSFAAAVNGDVLAA